jgi:hypothetical protein
MGETENPVNLKLPPLVPPWKWGKQKIQFPPLNKGRVRVGLKIFDTSIITF